MKPTFTIDLNCDMGEGLPNDAELMRYISSANIACGYHAGDETTMRKTIGLCVKNNVAIGAHPGFADKQNFGRAEKTLSTEELYKLVLDQLHAIGKICSEQSASLHHVKPHGALYNMAAKNKQMSNTIAQAVFDFNPNLILYGLSESFLISEAQNLGLKTANEVFADRTYQADGSLTPRTQKNALITDSKESILQVLQMIIENSVTTVDQKTISIVPETLCIHGDGSHAVALVKEIHTTLLQEGIQVKTI